jgi:membrane-associated protein
MAARTSLILLLGKPSMEFFSQIADLFLHLDVHLNSLAGSMGLWLYAILFLVIFAETGLVVTPFLPGDSLLFAVGALAAVGDVLHVGVLLPLLIIAAVLGDAVNYWIGYHVGPKVFQRESSWLLNKKHLLKAEQFYEKYGGKTIVLARFMPIVRTFAPFVAGIGKMSYRRFWSFNVVGGIAWVSLFLLGGYAFGESVKGYFHIVIFGIIFISVLPIGIEWYMARRRARQSPGGAPVVEPLRESA